MPIAGSDFYGMPTAASLVNKPSLLLDPSGGPADYGPSTPNTVTGGFNEAITALKNAGGGTLTIMGGTIIPTATLLCVGLSNAIINFSGDSFVVPPNAVGNGFNCQVVSGGATAIVILEVAGCSNLIINAPNGTGNANKAYSFVHFGGNNTSVTVLNLVASLMPRWAYVSTGYFSQGAVTQDGPVKDLLVYNAVSSSCGTNGADGGHHKIAPGMSASGVCHEGIWFVADYATGVQDFGCDLPTANFGTGTPRAIDIHVIHPHYEVGTGLGGTGTVGIVTEFNILTTNSVDYEILSPYVFGFDVGMNLNWTNNNIRVVSAVLDSCGVAGLKLGGFGGGTGSAQVVSWDITNLETPSCLVGILVDVSVFLAGGGFSGIRIKGGSSLNATTGLQLKTSGTHVGALVHFSVDGFDVSGSATPVDMSNFDPTNSSDVFVRCPGFNMPVPFFSVNQSAANANVLTVATPNPAVALGRWATRPAIEFTIHGQVFVNAATAPAFGVTVTYKDAGANTRVMIRNLVPASGVPVQSYVTAAANELEILTTRGASQQGQNIVVKTTFSGTSITYDVSGVLEWQTQFA